MSPMKTRKVYKRKTTIQSDGATIMVRCDAEIMRDLTMLSDAMDGANYSYTITRVLADVARIIRETNAPEPAKDWNDMSESRPFKSRLVSQFQLWNRGKK